MKNELIRRTNQDFKNKKEIYIKKKKIHLKNHSIKKMYQIIKIILMLLM
jgi:hypothetical protein